MGLQEGIEAALKFGAGQFDAAGMGDKVGIPAPVALQNKIAVVEKAAVGGIAAFASDFFVPEKSGFQDIAGSEAFQRDKDADLVVAADAGLLHRDRIKARDVPADLYRDQVVRDVVYRVHVSDHRGITVRPAFGRIDIALVDMVAKPGYGSQLPDDPGKQAELFVRRGLRLENFDQFFDIHR